VTLIEFLRARLDDDEATARAADPEWRTEHTRYHLAALDDEPAGHIARHNPARVLAEVDAKRRIVDHHAITVKKANIAPYNWQTGDPQPAEYDVTCEICGWVGGLPTSGCLTLQLLALPYADHPDYDPAWKP
jgi:hypothetical protein